MAYEWVAPVVAGAAGVAGIFFTWLTGFQARRQLERLADKTEHVARRKFVIDERKQAYMAALRFARICMVRVRYERKREEAKLRDLEQKWPVGEMVALGIETALAVDSFGSLAARKLVAQWPEAQDEAAMTNLYREMTALVRAELGTVEAALSTMPEDDAMAPIADYQ